MGKNDIEARGRIINRELRDLYKKYGHEKVTVSVRRRTSGGQIEQICGEHNGNVSIMFYPGKKIECTFNMENPELLGDFFKLQDDLTEWLNENGYSKHAGTYFGDFYILQLRY